MSDYENRSLDEMAYELDHWPTEDTTMEIAREFLRRLRHAEAVLSACEKEKPKKKKNANDLPAFPMPTTILQSATPKKQDYSASYLRIGAIFHRKDETKWSRKEIVAFHLLIPFDEEELAMVERYYKANRDKPNNICRRDVLTFLNNYRGEVDRAFGWCQRHPLKAHRTVRPPAPRPPEMTDEQIAANREFVHKEVEKLREKLRMRV